jgi:hypothetical protein
MPKRAPSRRAAARASFKSLAFFAGEAGLLGACSGYSDTLLVRNRRRCTTDALGQGRPRPDSRPDKLIELAPQGHATPDRPVDRSSTAGWPGPDGTSCSGADEERRARVGGLVF